MKVIAKSGVLKLLNQNERPRNLAIAGEKREITSPPTLTNVHSQQIIKINLFFNIASNISNADPIRMATRTAPD